MSTRTRTVGRAVMAVALSAGLLLSACGDDEDDAATDTTASEVSEPAESSTEPAGEEEAVEIELVDYKFEGVPDSVPAGTQLSITNSSEGELHELVVLALPEGEDRSIDELAALPEAELESLFTGPPAAVLLAPPGGEQIDAVGDGTLSEPGRYALICAIPTGVDPEEFLAASEESEEGPPEIPGAGPPHFMQGMYAELVVE